MSKTATRSVASAERVNSAREDSPAVPLAASHLPRWMAVVAMLAGVVFLWRGMDVAIRHALDAYLLDVGVFQDAGRAAKENLPLYSHDFPSRSGFRFLYPPIAAVLFEPLLWISMNFSENTMELTWTIASGFALLGVMAMVVRRLGFRWWWMWAIGLTGLAVQLEPIRTHLMYGQINIFLILLVTADVLGYTPQKVRGLGVGLAAGLKITPAAYALLFVVRKDWWSVARSVGFFLLTAALGFLFRGPESVYYWTIEFFNEDRGGPPVYPPNQALSGLITRAGVSESVEQAIMGPGFIVIALLTLYGAWKLRAAHRDVDALLMVVLGISLANPIAVTHHWSGIVIAVALVMVPANRWVLAGLIVLLTANYLGLYRLYPLGDNGSALSYHFEFPLWFVENFQGLAGLLLFVIYLVSVPRPQPHRNRSRDR